MGNRDVYRELITALRAIAAEDDGVLLDRIEKKLAPRKGKKK